MNKISENDQRVIFTDEEKDILQEIMNIAFGNATADLAELIDIQVILSVPDVQVLNFEALPDYLGGMIPRGQKNSVAGQNFWGEFNGSGLLFLPSGTERSLSRFLNVSHLDTPTLDTPTMDTPTMDEEYSRSPKDDDTIKSGLLLEISNILIGACVGKISDLLNTLVSYTPPEVLSMEKTDYNFLLQHFETEETAIVMKTVFQFDKQNVNGLLLIMTNRGSLGWLRNALITFMEQYE
ncbi:MAG: chemotaxis protein CheC [Desulfosudaceae bacterium]